MQAAEVTQLQAFIECSVKRKMQFYASRNEAEVHHAVLAFAAAAAFGRALSMLFLLSQ